MTVEMVTKSILPDFTLGRTGRDLFASRKDLTVIMIPFERFSPFAKAVDDLYKTIDVPFNLIVVEGCAPESVRSSLEKRKKKYKNINIVYSNHQTSVGASINLATPHLKTDYAFVIDNDVRVPAGAMSGLLQKAKDHQYGIVCPQNYALSVNGKQDAETNESQNLGIRTCFLISREAVQKLGRLDENMSPFTTDLDIRMAANELMISFFSETEPFLETGGEKFLWPMDATLHSFQWNEERVYGSLMELEKKWGIRLQMKDCVGWLMNKRRALTNSRQPLRLLSEMFSKIKLSHHEKTSQKSPEKYLVPEAA